MSGTLRLRGATSGYSELQAPAVAADQTFILPTTGGTLLTTDSPVAKLTLELGSASQPSLTFEGDTDTGLYSSGTNTLNLVTGGSDRLIIDSSGNVGIGTGTPDEKLNVVGAIRLTSNATSFTSSDGALVDWATDTMRLVAARNGANSSKMIFVAYNAGTAVEAMRIDSSGNVGIGTTSPSDKLTVGDTTDSFTSISIESTNTGIGELRFADSDSANPAYVKYEHTGNNLIFAVNASERMRIDSSGNLGIGTSNPGVKLVVEEGAAPSGLSQTNINILRSNYGGQIGGYIDQGVGHGLTFSSVDSGAATERMRIESSGKVGINKTGPQAMLNVYAAENTATFLAEGEVDNPGYPSYGFAGQNLDNGTRGAGMYLPADSTLAFSTAAAERMRIDASGNIGIGTTSTRGKLDVRGNVSFGPTNTTDQFQGLSFINGKDSSAAFTISYLDFKNDQVVADSHIFASHETDGSAQLIFGTTPAGSRTADRRVERMRIDGSGRLLVGATTTVSSSSSVNSTFQVHSTSGPAMFGRFANDATASALYIVKSRNTTVGGQTIVNNGDNIGRIAFEASDGSQLRRAATVDAFVDGTPGSADMPGRLVFSTTADGAATPTEHLRITQSGKLRAPEVYNQTTTTGGAVYVQSDGDLLRFTSSAKYKTDVETIQDARADAILNCRPVWYRSTCESDITTEGSEKSDWGWYGFIAEEVAEIEPRLVNWATKDAVEQEDGSMESVQRDPADYTAEGVRYENFVPLLLNLVKRQQAAIETLEANNLSLENRIAALENN